MGKRSNAPTMKDVAAEAGVALGTVSKVVNGLPVGAGYEKRVKAAIQKLGYKVNTYAQALRADKTYTIAFLIPNTDNPYFGWLTYHVNRLLAERKYRMLLCCTDAASEYEEASLEMLKQNNVDGVIILTYSEHLPILGEITSVTIDRHIAQNVPCVSSDNFEGGRLAAQMLLNSGCRKLAFFSVSSSLPSEVSKRCDGFRSACDAFSAEYQILTLKDGTPFLAIADFLRKHTVNGKLEFDGLFCNTDLLASLTIRHLRSAGIRVPEDVQVIGFDGIRDYATGEYLCSTIVQSVEEIARTAVDMVLRDPEVPVPSLICLPVSYAYGKTTRETVHE